MKTALMVMLFIGGCIAGEAQTPKFKEIFKQKKTQREYLIRQVAALKIYFGYLKKGYEIAGKGLRTVGDIKNTSFDLDKDYLGSLKRVSPVVRNSPGVDDIFLYHQHIQDVFRALYSDCQDDENLTPEEVRYIRAVYRNMLGECNGALDELQRILTAGETEMNDDERLRRLEKVCADMLDRYSFTQNFAGSTRLLIQERARENHYLKGSVRLHAIQ